MKFSFNFIPGSWSFLFFLLVTKYEISPKLTRNVKSGWNWHRTFYHITHEGEDETNRQPDIRRMERIHYPEFVIEQNLHPEILIWKNRRGKDERILLFNESENYIVVLTERKEFYLFITAYVVETSHRKRSLLKEYEAYKKAKTA